MELNFCRHGAIVAVASLLLVVACGTASQSQRQAQAKGNQRSDATVAATIGERTITLWDVDQNCSKRT